MSEPVGGLVGYLALSGNNDLAFAIVFGLVAGMMVFIAIKVRCSRASSRLVASFMCPCRTVRELIPMALRYGPHGSVPR